MAKHSETEYVYNYGEPFEYRKVTVGIFVEEDSLMLHLQPDHMMTEGELEGMLKGFQADVLNKKRISLTGECRVVMAHDGKEYQVELEDSGHVVKGIVPA